MGCGSSGHVVTPEATSNGHKTNNGVHTNGNNGNNGNNGHHDDDLPTVVLPDTPAKPKPPIAYEIPLEEFASSRRPAATPPPHLRRLLHPPAAPSRPHIEERLAEAESRRQALLQQRAMSAQKRTQKMIKNLQDIEMLENALNTAESTKHGTNVVTIPPEPVACEHKMI